MGLPVLASFQRGWLSPTGEFVPCDYYCHAAVLKLKFGLTESEAEQAGWWRLTGIAGPKWYGFHQATPEQRCFLIKWHQDQGLERPHWTFFLPQAGLGQSPCGIAAPTGGGASKA